MQDIVLVIVLIVIGIAGYIVMSKFGIFFEEKNRKSFFHKRDKDSYSNQPQEDPFDDEF